MAAGRGGKTFCKTLPVGGESRVLVLDL